MKVALSSTLGGTLLFGEYATDIDGPDCAWASPRKMTNITARPSRLANATLTLAEKRRSNTDWSYLPHLNTLRHSDNYSPQIDQDATFRQMIQMVRSRKIPFATTALSLQGGPICLTPATWRSRRANYQARSLLIPPRRKDVPVMQHRPRVLQAILPGVRIRDYILYPTAVLRCPQQVIPIEIPRGVHA